MDVDFVDVLDVDFVNVVNVTHVLVSILRVQDEWDSVVIEDV